MITPWEVAIACMEEAVLNEVKLHLEEPVTNIKKKDEGYQVITTKGSYETSYVINAAGLYADDIYRMLDESGGSKGQIVPVKGEYLVLDRSKSNMVNRVIYPLPSKAG